MFAQVGRGPPARGGRGWRSEREVRWVRGRGAGLGGRERGVVGWGCGGLWGRGWEDPGEWCGGLREGLRGLGSRARGVRWVMGGGGAGGPCEKLRWVRGGAGKGEEEGEGEGAGAGGPRETGAVGCGGSVG